MEKRIFELTVTEFMDMLKEQISMPEASEPKAETKMLYSLRELADFLQCSIPTAQKIKNSGRIPFAQTGRKLVFNSEAVLNAISNDKKSVSLKTNRVKQ